MPSPIDSHLQSVATPYCQIEFTDLVHVTGDYTQVYCLNPYQLQRLIKEAEHVSSPIKKMMDSYSQTNEQILQCKQQTWETLKENRLIPALKPVQHLAPIEKYDAQWRLAQKRYKRQLRRLDRLGEDAHHVESELGRGWINQEGRNFLTRYAASLSQDYEDLSLNIENLKQLALQKKGLLNSENKRLKKLQSAVESEVTYRTALQANPPETSIHIEQLKTEAKALAEEANLTMYITDDELQTITRATLRIQQLNVQIDDNASQMWELRCLKFLHQLVGPKKLYGKADDSLKEYSQKQIQLNEEKAELTQENTSFYNSLQQKIPIDYPAFMPLSFYQYQLIELKHTGAKGFSYIRKESLEQFKKNWQKIPMSEVKSALKLTKTGIKDAAKQAGKGLAENRGFKLKYSLWQSDADHLFNQLNEELFNVSLNDDELPEDKRFAASAEAQLMRFTAGAQFAGEYNPENGRIHVGAEAGATFDLLQASVTSKIFMPNEAGYALKLSYENASGELQQLNCGLFRTQFDLTLKGSAGACAMLSSTVNINSQQGTLNIGGETQGSVFAGGMMKSDAKIAVAWAKPPEFKKGAASRINSIPTPKFKELVTVSASAAVAFGIGAGFDFEVTYVRGKFVLQLSAQLVCGPGGSGGCGVELDAGQVLELIQFIRLSLEESDFRFLEWVSAEAFDMLSKITEVFSAFDKPLGTIISLTKAALTEQWLLLSTNQIEVKIECQNILSQAGKVSLLTPVAKARVLHRVSQTFWLNEQNTSLDYDELQAKACMRILDSIHSEREFIEILRCMNAKGEKMRAHGVVNNYIRLFNALLYQSEQRIHASNWLRKLMSKNIPDLE